MDSQNNVSPVIGRITRLQFWVTVLLFYVPGALIAEFSSGGVAIVILLLVTIPIIYVHIGRSHDLGYSGWMTLLLLIPIVGFVVSIFFAFIKGEEKDNKYGPNPYVKKDLKSSL